MLYLMVRKKGYYVRVAVPRPVRAMFGGKSHIIYSLKTKVLKVAQERRWVEVAKIRAQIQAAQEAKGNAEKFRLEKVRLDATDWRKKISGGGFQASKMEWNAEKQKVLKAHGQEAMQEFVQISFNMRGHPLNHLEENWFAAADLTNRTKIHYRHCRELLAAHLRHEGLPEAIESVDSKVALSFRKYLVEQKTHVTTGNSYLGGLRSRFQMLIEEEVIEPPNPFTGISLKGSRRGKEPDRLPYSASELVTLFTGDIEQPLFDIMCLALCGALRRGEIVPRLVRDLEGDWLIVRYGKGHSSVRRVPIASILRTGMKRLIKGKAPDDFIFDFRGTTVEAKKNNVTEDMTAYRQDVCGIMDPKKDGLHSLRHNWTNTALEHGIEWHVTQAVVGHAPSSGQAVTAGYGHLGMLDAPKRQAIEAVVKALPAPVKKIISTRFGRS